MRFRSLLAALLVLAAPMARAQEPASAAPVAAAQAAPAESQVPNEPGKVIEKKLGPADIIMPHITDARSIEVPCFNKEWACEIHLPSWPVTIGGTTIDFGPTKHVVFMLLAAFLCALVLIGSARSHVKHSQEAGRPKGFAAGLEAVVLYLRNEVFLPAIGHHGEAYVPFVLTLFFFILFMNLMGLVPYGSTPTGNISVTAMLAICSFIATELAGIRAQGVGYLRTIVYWPSDMSVAMKLPLTIVMTPVEIIGKFTKPFALTIRLFANMTAGHVIVLAMIGLVFTFQSWAIAPAPILMAVGIMLLEVLVAFIQAFIFALLASVFIGQIRASHH
ncbi:MAG TPA: F0F1 ATP synthase subunit A [Gemmatimonadaceae bacterium]|nr:F0F1 ATP synthase subunit A [Gemmatimonadaceae bacterium]